MGDEAEETILLTKDLAVKAFKKWHTNYENREGEWSPDLDGDRSAEYFFKLVEGIAINGK